MIYGNNEKSNLELQMDRDYCWITNCDVHIVDSLGET